MYNLFVIFLSNISITSILLQLQYLTVIQIGKYLKLVSPERSRQGVGTGHESSNFAASHYLN